MTEKNIVKTILTLAASLGICLLAAYMAWYPALPGMPAWYDGLVKPLFSPPSWLFSPIWIASFVLMGVILFLIFQSGIKKRDVTFGLLLFAFQLLFMLVWAFSFFGLHALFIAFMCIIALWATLICAVIQAFRYSVFAGMLFIPYFLWVCYLAYLNYGFMVLNNALFVIAQL
jgi:tryptophan-rich sensory protein